MQPNSPLFDEESDQEFAEAPPLDENLANQSEYELFNRFALATLRKRELEREAKEATQEITLITPYLINFFDAHPESGGMKMHGLTIFRRSQIYARVKEGSTRQEVCDALRACGMGQFVHDAFSGEDLSDHVRALEEEHAEELARNPNLELADLLPGPVAAVLNVEPKTSIVGVKSRKA
jgi:hypothetical protein